MKSAVVRVVAEWARDPVTGVRRVEDGQGVIPECRVGDLPVLVISSSSDEDDGALAKTKRAWKEASGADGVLVITGDAGPGWIRISATPSERHRVEAAFAAALVKVAWGWDESSSIRVEDPRGVIEVALELEASSVSFRARVVKETFEAPGASPSPWSVVISLVERFEQALVVTWLFEYRDAALLANDRSLAEVLDGAPSERGVAEWLAMRMREVEGGMWRYVDFYRPTRGNVDATEDEVRAFVRRCAEAGVRLHYDDGTDAPFTTSG